MKIRGKLLVLLLFTALIPLLLSAVLHRFSMRSLGDRLAEESREVLTDNAFMLLQDLVDEYGRILQRDRNILLLAIRLQAREAELRLDGSRPGLPPMQDVYPLIEQFHPDLISRQMTVLESGALSRSPGAGTFPYEEDPREGAWYRRTKQAGRLTWTFLREDDGEFLKLFLAMPIFHPDGSFAGATAIDIPFGRALQGLKHPERWSEGGQAFLVSTEDPRGSGGPRLRVALVRPENDPASGWRRPNPTRYLESDDDPEFRALVEDAVVGRSGVRKMPFEGSEALWAYGVHEPGALFPLIIVPYRVVIGPAEAAETYVLDQTRNNLKITGTIMLAVILAVVLLALHRSRAVSRPVSQLADAATRLVQGDFQARVDIRTGDELQDLGAIFNDLGPKLVERERMKQSLILAQGVQQHLLPGSPPPMPGIDIFGRSAFCDETGGDYFDFIELGGPEERNLGLIVGDVSGHGVGAALHMAFARGVIRSVASHFHTDLEKPFLELNRHLLDSMDASEFMTLFYGALDPAAKSLRWNSAGHGPVFRVTGAGRGIEELPATGPPLGVLDRSVYKPLGPLPLKAGDILLVGTDGIWEAQNDRGEMFGVERLKEVLRSGFDKPAAGIYEEVLGAVGEFCGRERPGDDVTLVVVKVL